MTWEGGEYRGEILCLFHWQDSVPSRDAPHKLRNAGVSQAYFWTSFLGNISPVSEMWNTNKHSGWVIVFVQPHGLKKICVNKIQTLQQKKTIYRQLIQRNCLLTCLSGSANSFWNKLSFHKIYYHDWLTQFFSLKTQVIFFPSILAFLKCE